MEGISYCFYKLTNQNLVFLKQPMTAWILIETNQNREFAF